MQRNCEDEQDHDAEQQQLPSRIARLPNGRHEQGSDGCNQREVDQDKHERQWHVTPVEPPHRDVGNPPA